LVRREKKRTIWESKMSKIECILARIDIVAFSALSESPFGEEVVFNSAKAILSNLNEQIRRLNESVNRDQKLEYRGLYGDTFDIYFRAGDYDRSLIKTFPS
jgi:hypothetical protein